MPVNITFRTQLLGGVVEFCNACRIPLIENSVSLVELVVMLAKYKEEGVSLYPEVYVTTDISSLMLMLPESERVELGKQSRDVSGIKHAIKKCAPLSHGGWLVYLEDHDDCINFGLFKGSENPISVMVDNIILDPNGGTPVTKIYQVADDCVEILNCSGERHYIFLNHRKDDSPPPLQSMDALLSAITRNVRPDLIDPTRSYLSRVLYNSLRTSHGTLLAVTDRRSPPVKIFDDGIKLSAPLDFPSKISEAKKYNGNFDKLNSMSSLLSGMVGSDGIVLFDDKARVLGFNYFVRAKQRSRESGGARRRAFATLSSHLGNGVIGAFIQSQDGWSEFQGDRI